MPGAPPKAGTTSPESSARAGKRLVSAAARAFNAALASNVSPVSSGSGKPSSAAETVGMPNGASRSAISTTFPELWLAMTSLSPPSGRGIASRQSERGALQRRQLRDAQTGQRQHRVELRLVERRALGGRLDLDDADAAGQHEIRVR